MFLLGAEQQQICHLICTFRVIATADPTTCLELGSFLIVMIVGSHPAKYAAAMHFMCMHAEWTYEVFTIV